MIRVGVLGGYWFRKIFYIKIIKFPVFNADNEVKKIYKNIENVIKIKKNYLNFIKSFPIKKSQLNKSN